jgi:hypothetical protein
MNKKLALIFILFTIILSGIRAQRIRVEIQGSANYPVFPTYTRSVFPYKWVPIANESGNLVIDKNTRVQESYKDNVGGEIGLKIMYDLKNNFFLRTGIGLNFMSFKRNIQYTNLPASVNTGYGDWTNGNTEVHSDDIGKTFLLYTNIPVSAGYRFLKKKLIINLGITVSLLAYSQQYIIDPYTKLYGLYDELMLDKTGMGLANLSVSADAELAYQISRKFSIFTRYSRQLTPMYDKDFQYVGKAKYNLIELGAGYTI